MDKSNFINHNLDKKLKFLESLGVFPQPLDIHPTNSKGTYAYSSTIAIYLDGVWLDTEDLGDLTQSNEKLVSLHWIISKREKCEFKYLKPSLLESLEFACEVGYDIAKGLNLL